MGKVKIAKTEEEKVEDVKNQNRSVGGFGRETILYLELLTVG